MNESEKWKWSCSVVSNSSQPHAACRLSRVQLFTTPCSLPGSSIHGIFQARALEWGAIALSERGFLAPFIIAHLIAGRDTAILILACDSSSPAFHLIDKLDKSMKICWIVWALYIFWILISYQIYDLKIFSPIPEIAFSFCQWFSFCSAETFQFDVIPLIYFCS